jgi:hypothetical protein
MDEEITKNGYDNLEDRIQAVTEGKIFKDIDFQMLFHIAKKYFC